MSAVLNQAQVTLERTILTIMTKRISAFHVMLRLRCFLYARCLHYTCCVIVVLFYVTYCQKTHFVQILVKISCRNAKQPWEISNNLWNPLIVDMVHYLGHRNRTVYTNFKCLQKKCHASLADECLQLLDMIIIYLMTLKKFVKEFVWADTLFGLVWNTFVWCSIHFTGVKNRISLLHVSSMFPVNLWLKPVYYVPRNHILHRLTWYF